MIIKIKDEINDALDFNQSATDFINKINQINNDDFVIDFSGVFYISRSFAQAYYASKKRSPKNITEINMSDDVRPMMDMIEKQIYF
ncbi:hypothetical protein [uncultured Methanobrevibacter sp.]|uniref:hypothetical protein n=1 Tax=uncultured Methanobrevibacter sp. TaxID=253161 RepID=UPI0025EF8B78|nr:hypothetical protein [uncultured Methanobrevibacter sp.]